MKKKSNLNKFIPVNQPRITRDNANDVFNADTQGNFNNNSIFIIL